MGVPLNHPCFLFPDFPLKKQSSYWGYPIHGPPHMNPYGDQGEKHWPRVWAARASLNDPQSRQSWVIFDRVNYWIGLVERLQETSRNYCFGTIFFEVARKKIPSTKSGSEACDSLCRWKHFTYPSVHFDNPLVCQDCILVRWLAL